MLQNSYWISNVKSNFVNWKFGCLFPAALDLTLQWKAKRHSAALFLTFLYIKYSLRKFPIWNIHSECCLGPFPAYSQHFQSYSVFRTCSSWDLKAMSNEQWVPWKQMSFITHSITFHFSFSGTWAVLSSPQPSMLQEKKWATNTNYASGTSGLLSEL